jgi:hypothetical protein
VRQVVSTYTQEKLRLRTELEQGRLSVRDFKNQYEAAMLKYAKAKRATDAMFPEESYEKETRTDKQLKEQAKRETDAMATLLQASGPRHG